MNVSTIGNPDCVFPALTFAHAIFEYRVSGALDALRATDFESTSITLSKHCWTFASRSIEGRFLVHVIALERVATFPGNVGKEVPIRCCARGAMHTMYTKKFLGSEHLNELIRMGIRDKLAANVRCFAGPVAVHNARIVVQKGLSAAPDTTLSVLVGPKLTYIAVWVIPVWNGRSAIMHKLAQRAGA